MTIALQSAINLFSVFLCPIKKHVDSIFSCSYNLLLNCGIVVNKCIWSAIGTVNLLGQCFDK